MEHCFLNMFSLCLFSILNTAPCSSGEKTAMRAQRMSRQSKMQFFLGWNLVVIIKSPLFRSSNELRIALIRSKFDWWKKKMDLIMFSMHFRWILMFGWTIASAPQMVTGATPKSCSYKWSFTVNASGDKRKSNQNRIDSKWMEGQERPIDKENSIVVKVWSEWEGVEGKCPTG